VSGSSLRADGAGIESERGSDCGHHSGHTNFELHVERQPVCYPDFNTVAHGGVKVFPGDGELIFTRRQQWKTVRAVIVGIDGRDDSGLDVFDFDFASGDDGAVRIGDLAGE
jgi:hypothetical protein